MEIIFNGLSESCPPAIPAISVFPHSFLSLFMYEFISKAIILAQVQYHNLLFSLSIFPLILGWLFDGLNNDLNNCKVFCLIIISLLLGV